MSFLGSSLKALFPLLILAACSARPPAVPDAAPPPGQTPAADAAPSAQPAGVSDAERQRAGYTAADVKFMQDMIGHHAQALRMAELVPARTSRPDFRLLAERIDVSQKDEIAFMQRWLRRRGESVPDGGAHAQHGADHSAHMPGMLTEEELGRLAAASGVAFERLFLESMIKHHEGALVMVKELFATPRGGQEPELFTFAADVDADQNAEIRRMRSLLDALPRQP